MNSMRARLALVSPLVVLSVGVWTVGDEGYTLFAPLRSAITYLIDVQGNVVHTWESDTTPGHAVYLLENGNLLRCERDDDQATFHGGGLGGRIREFTWDGSLVWTFDYSDDAHCQHHDIEPLPNGNVLILAWERKTGAEAVAAGRDPALLGSEGIWPDHIVEIEPERPHGGKVVWEWHVWDHLIQDRDPGRDNYGVVADHPERVDINFNRFAKRLSPKELRRLRALGYVGGSSKPDARGSNPDWNHANAVAYNAELDQIALSVLGFNEIWIIDHGTTREEAASHSGGRSGKGGDLLYRWGNPQAYRAGTAADQQLYAQHDVQWIAPGLSGAGHLLVFNNGRRRPDGNYSSIDEIAPPVDEQGRYGLRSGSAYGPARPAWRYGSPKKRGFFSALLSGAQRLPNGNTLICDGVHGLLFEVTPDGKTVWEYVCPIPRTEPAKEDQARAPGQRGRAPNSVFKVQRYAPDHPGLAGKDLTPKGRDTDSTPAQPPKDRKRGVRRPSSRPRVERQRDDPRRP